MFVSETYELEDCKYWNDGSSVGSLEVGSNVSCTSNGEYITITTSKSGEKDVKLPVTLTGDWEYEVTLASQGTTNPLTFKVGTGQQWGAISGSNFGVNLGNGTTNYPINVTVGYSLKITYINGVMSVYWNNELLTSNTVSVSGKIGYYTNSGRVQNIKNIKLKAL